MWAKVEGYRWWPAHVLDPNDHREEMRDAPKLPDRAKPVLVRFHHTQDIGFMAPSKVLDFAEHVKEKSAGGKKRRRVRAGRRRRQSRARHGNRRHERGSRWRSKPGHRRLEQKNQSPGSDLRRQGQRRGSHKAAFRHETRAHTTRVREGRGGGPAQAAGGGGRGGTTPRGTEGHPRRTGRRRWVPARRGVAGAGETRGWPERRRGWIRYRGRIRQRCIVGWGGCG